MRTKFAVVFVLLALVAGMSVAGAQTQSLSVSGQETGAVLNISWGTGDTQISSRLVMKSDSGRDVATPAGVCMVPRTEGTIGQIVFAHDGRLDPNRIVFSYSTLAAPVCDSDWCDAKFDPRVGWVFRVDPREYVGSGIYDTPLHLRVLLKDGKSRYIRVIFKITYGHSDQISREVLFIRPYDPTPAPVPGSVAGPAVADPVAIDANFAAVKAALGGVEANQATLAVGVNDERARNDEQDARLQRLEQWAASATAQSQPAPATMTEVTVEQSLREKYAGSTGYVFYSQATTVRSFWKITEGGWTRCTPDVSIGAGLGNETIWRCNPETYRAKGWLGFGLGVGDAKPNDIIPLRDGLNTWEVK